MWFLKEKVLKLTRKDDAKIFKFVKHFTSAPTPILLAVLGGNFTVSRIVSYV